MENKITGIESSTPSPSGRGGRGVRALIITAILLSLMPLHAHERCSSRVKVYNPGSPQWKNYASGWERILKSRKIYNWGRSRGLYLIEDRGPVADGRAAYVSSKGSKIVLTDIKQGCFYRLWIDFVGFRFSGKKNPPRVLNIYTGREEKGRRLLKSIRFTDLNRNKMEYIDIPYGMTVNETFDIIFGDYSTENGFWGIWDMVLTTEREMPVSGTLPGKGKSGTKKK